METDDIISLIKVCNEKIYAPNEVGNSLHNILNRIKNESESINTTTVISYRNCLNCKYCHSEEIFDSQWGRFFAGNHRCDKGKTMPECFAIGNTSDNCDCYEQGQGIYDRISDKEKKKIFESYGIFSV